MESPSVIELSDMELCSLSSSEQSSSDGYDSGEDVDEGLGLIGHGPSSGVEEYVHNILDTYRRTEDLRRPARDYLATQKELDEGKRWELSDWMIGKHHGLQLRPEILYLAFDIVDRYLSLQIVASAELWPVGASALFLASKYHKRQGHEARYFTHAVYFSRSVREAMLEKEKDILRKLRWNLSGPTPHEFLTMFLKAGPDCDEELQYAVFFFGELGLMDYSAVALLPSLRAASAIYAARCTLGRRPVWPGLLMQVITYTELQLLDAAESLVRLHAEGNKHKAVHEKYAAADRKAVALRPPATLVMEERKAVFSPVHETLRHYYNRRVHPARA